MTIRLDTPAATARSILACPDQVRLVVDGIDDVTDGLDGLDGDVDGGLALRDVDGRPVLGCPPGSALAVAALEGRGALLTVTSGLGRSGSPERDAVLTLGGRVRADGLEECDCCDRVQATVSLELADVVLAPGGADADGRAVRVDLADFRSSRHHLNRGFLQRSADHANACHQDELRRAVATTVGTRLGEVVGVQLTDLRPDRVELRWVDPTGAHRRLLRFGRPATTTAELGDLLRRELHAGLC